MTYHKCGPLKLDNCIGKLLHMAFLYWGLHFLWGDLNWSLSFLSISFFQHSEACKSLLGARRCYENVVLYTVYMYPRYRLPDYCSSVHRLQSLMLHWPPRPAFVLILLFGTEHHLEIFWLAEISIERVSCSLWVSANGLISIPRLYSLNVSFSSTDPIQLCVCLNFANSPVCMHGQTSLPLHLPLPLDGMVGITLRADLWNPGCSGGQIHLVFSVLTLCASGAQLLQGAIILTYRCGWLWNGYITSSHISRQITEHSCMTILSDEHRWTPSILSMSCILWKS